MRRARPCPSRDDESCMSPILVSFWYTEGASGDGDVVQDLVDIGRTWPCLQKIIQVI
jgi:hypothetical protein